MSVARPNLKEAGGKRTGVREITDRSRPLTMEERIHRLNRFMMGWIGYFRLAAAKNHCGNLDAWIRRRLRMCLWKQWKRPKTRLCNLRALGVPEWAARILDYPDQ